jgi:hypothetical protein
MSRQSTPSPVATIGIDIGKNTFLCARAGLYADQTAWEIGKSPVK